MAIAAIFGGDRCRVVSRRIVQNPRNSSKKGRDKKKIAGSGPSGAKSLGKRGFPAVEMRRKWSHPCQNGHNWT
jgi:hypothetical protein